MYTLKTICVSINIILTRDTDTAWTGVTGDRSELTFDCRGNIYNRYHEESYETKKIKVNKVCKNQKEIHQTNTNRSSNTSNSDYNYPYGHVETLIVKSQPPSCIQNRKSRK